jgi:uncharacterized membrane protein
MKLSVGQIIGLGLVGASFALHVALYDLLPDPVPHHWNARGAPDDFMAKPWGAFVNPIVMAFVWVLYSVAPIISPRTYELRKSKESFDIPLVGVLTLLFIITSTTFLRAAGWSVTIQHIIPIGLGVLLMVLGNYMGKIRRNFFIGIRTPWTLADEEVWLRTHQFGGKVTVVAGALVVITAIAGMAGRWLLPIVIFDALISAGYSFVVYKRLEAAKRA